MSLDAGLKIIAYNEAGEECFKYSPEMGSHRAFEEILTGESKMIKDGLLGMLSEEEIEMFKFEYPFEYDKYDFSIVKMKDPKFLLGVLEKIKSHFVNYELKSKFKEDIKDGDDNWILSLVRSEVEILEDMGRVMSILDLAVQMNCTVKAYMVFY